MSGATEERTFARGRPLAVSLGLGPEDVRALVRFAERDARRGRVEDALEALRVAAILDPREASVWAALASCHGAAGNAAQAASASRVGDAFARLGAPGPGSVDAPGSNR